jgi:hypothetical protein
VKFGVDEGNQAVEGVLAAVLPGEKEPRHVGWWGFQNATFSLSPAPFYTRGRRSNRDGQDHVTVFRPGFRF